LKPHVFHPAAAAEYADAAEYYAAIQMELGGRFYDEIERLIEDVHRQPDRFRIFMGATRRHFSDVFPYAVVYLSESDRIWIVAVMHMHREPGYWKSRLKS
jgi:plasmid stabilization system protein ParE